MKRPIARARPDRFMLLVYRMPPNPTAGRVAVWRLLKKIGAIYLQQSVCVFPDNARVRRELSAILARIGESSGEYHLLPLRTLSTDEDAKLADQFLEQTNKHYDEIIENCEINFMKEIEFETFRSNFTYEEAEEIRTEFEKICSWFEGVRKRDWFSSPREADARAWIHKCEEALVAFEAKVYAVQERISTVGLKATPIWPNGKVKRLRAQGRSTNIVPSKRARPSKTPPTIDRANRGRHSPRRASAKRRPRVE